MNNKIITRNKNNLPINFCTTGNFLNLNKIKFIPIDKSLKINNKKLSKKKSLSNLSQTILNKEKNEINKDKLIKKLKERIVFLENKIKILEKEIENNKKDKKNLHNKALILRMNSLNKSLHQTNKITTIPIDKNLLKTKLIKKKRNLFELLDVNKILKKNRSNSFYANELNISKNSKNKSNSTINHSTSNYLINNNSCSCSSFKSKKKYINFRNKSNTITSLHNLLYSISSKTAKSKGSSSIEQKKRKSMIGRKISAIPKKGRKNINDSAKLMMMSSTNYSNNISEINMKKNSPKKVVNNNSFCSFCEKNNFNEIKDKLENIKKRANNLLGFYSSISFDKYEINKFDNNINNNNNIINKEKIFADYSHYVKINKSEK